MKKEKVNYFVAHYEPLKDGRYILCIEPNLFDNHADAVYHAKVLHYLSGQTFITFPEDNISEIPFFVSSDLQEAISQ